MQWFDLPEGINFPVGSEVPQAIILQSSPESAETELKKLQMLLEAGLETKTRRPYVIVIMNSESSASSPDALTELSQSGADRILLLPHDDQKLCELYAISLSPISVDIVPVADPRSLFATMAAVQPHLLLIDVHLGTHKGLELAAAIRQQPRWDGLPLILLSTDNSMAQVTAASHDRSGPPCADTE